MDIQKAALYCLGIAVCGILVISLGIFDIGFTEDKDCGMWQILNEETGLYHDHYTFGF